MLKVFSAVTFYTVFAISLVVLNKVLLSRFEAPLTSLWAQAIVSTSVTKIFTASGVVKVDFNARTMIDTWKVHAISSVSLIMGALSLQAVDASAFHTVARSLTIPMTALFSSILLHQSHSWLVVCGCLLISFGYATTLWIDLGWRPSFTIAGIIFGLLASTVSAVHTVWIKSSARVNLSDAEAVYYGNLFFVIFASPLLWFERLQISRFLARVDDTLYFMNASLLVGVIAVLFNFSIIFQIRTTSPLTHAISSSMRGVLQNVVCLQVFNEPPTGGKLVGSFFVLLGTITYLWGKQQKVKN